MARMSTVLSAFNRGLVSKRALARVEVKRVQMSAEVMTNFLPQVLGPMSIRPGWKYLGSTRGNAAAKLIPFVFAVDDTHLLEITTGAMRVWRDDELVTRGTVGTSVTNGAFTSNLNNWTDSDESGAASTFETGGYMQLLGTGETGAIRDQEVTVSGGDANDEHALTIVVFRGPVTMSIGSTQGGGEYHNKRELGTGTHSLAFTPTGNFWIRFYSRLSYPVLVDSVAVEAAGVMTVAAPWAAGDLSSLRWDQSGDIVFVACEGEAPYLVKRYGLHSWSIETYEPLDGPFLTENASTITITPSALTGVITLEASQALFRSTHVGALFSIASEGQSVTEAINAQNTFSDAINVTGVDASRVFTIIITGTWSATVTLQRSLDSDSGPWEDIDTFSANTTESFDDGLDNQIAWYRIGVKTGQYTSGTANATLDYALGSIRGVARITSVTDSENAEAIALSDMGGTDPTEVWAEGAWSDFRGYPTAVAFHEARLWWAGKSKVWGSITDAFDSFDPDYEGDAGPISRSLGVGPVDRVNWLFSSQRLLIGADINEYAARSSSLDEPLTPSQFNIKATSNQGSAAIMPGRIDSVPAFVNRTGMKVFSNEINGQTFEYGATDLCHMVPEIGDPQIVRMAVQRQPDTRIHAIRSDGTVALCVFDKTEDVNGWCDIETDGEVEDVAVLPATPGVTDDYVYYIVKREIDGAEVRYLEKWAQAKETRGGVAETGGESPFRSYSAYEVVQTDTMESGNDIVEFLPLDDGESFVVGGTGSDSLYFHPDEPFTSAPTISAAPDNIHEGSGSICPSDDGTGLGNGRYIWKQGQQSGANPSNIYVYDRVTETWTDMGNAFGTWNKIVYATDSPLRVWVGGASDLAMFAPTIGTGSMGASVWFQNNGGQFDFNGGQSYPFLRTTDDFLWWCGGTKLLQVAMFTGSYVLHNLPTLVGYSSSIGGRRPTYDAVNERIFVSLGGGHTQDAYIYSYSAWDTSPPLADSGDWTLEITIDPPGGTFYGMAIHYDPDSEVIFLSQRIEPFGSGARVLRYWRYPFVLIDDVQISYVTPTVDIFGYDVAMYNVFYQNDCGYIGANSSTTADYLIKIRFEGPEILADSEGESLVPGGLEARVNALADSFCVYQGAPTDTITGLDHLEGETVVVWADGLDVGTDDDYEQTYTVLNGEITLEVEASVVVVGLPYTAQFKSSKTAIQSQTEILFGKQKRIDEIAFVLADTHAKGIRFGPDFDTLDDRPLREGWADVDADEITEAYDEDTIPFNSEWATDLRVCLQAQAPRPCTVMACKLIVEA